MRKRKKDKLRMDLPEIKFMIKTADEERILRHLTLCKNDFIPPLDLTVGIEAYAKKIFQKAVTFEAWSNGSLVGLAAAYFNDLENKAGYITSVSLNSGYTGKGIASELVRRCIGYGKEHNFKDIALEVNEANFPAIKLYKKFGFIDYERKNGSIFMKLTL